MAQLESRDRNPEHWRTPEILRVKGLIASSSACDQAAAADFFSRSGSKFQEFDLTKIRSMVVRFATLPEGP
jgi:hypothetical protein